MSGPFSCIVNQHYNRTCVYRESDKDGTGLLPCVHTLYMLNDWLIIL